MIRIAFRSLWTRKSRTALAILGLLLGVATIISLISITDGIREEVGGVLSQITGISVMEKDVFMPTLSHIPIERIEKMEQIAGVKVASGRVMTMVLQIDEKGGGIEGWTDPVMIMGLDTEKEWLTAKSELPTGEKIVRGRVPVRGERFVAVISEDFSDDHNKVVGSTVKLGGHNFKIIGIYGSEISMGGASRIATTIDAARELADDLPNDMVSQVYIEPNNPRDAARIATMVEFMYDDVSATTGEEMGEQINTLLGSIDAFLWLISVIATVVAGLGIINTMLMSIRERYREFGVLRAVGWTKNNVLRLVMYESVLLGVGGGIIGIVFGYVLVQLAKMYVSIPMTVTLQTAALAFVFAVFVGLIGGIYPAWKVSNLDPLEAIRSED